MARRVTGVTLILLLSYIILVKEEAVEWLNLKLRIVHVEKQHNRGTVPRSPAYFVFWSTLGPSFFQEAMLRFAVVRISKVGNQECTCSARGSTTN